MLQELRQRNSAATSGWDCPLLTFIYPGFVAHLGRRVSSAHAPRLPMPGHIPSELVPKAASNPARAELGLFGQA